MKEDELQVPGQETAKEESEASSSNAPAADSETTSQDEEDEYSTSSGSDILDYYRQVLKSRTITAFCLQLTNWMDQFDKFQHVATHLPCTVISGRS